MATMIRDAVIRIGLQQIDAQLKAPDITPITAAQDEIRKQVEGLTAAHSELQQKQQEQVKAAQQALQAQSAEQEKHTATVTEANLRAFESFKKVGEGAFTAARGIALLSSNSDEDLQKMIRSIAAVQGAFDVFKGTTDVVQGGIQAYKEFPEAIQAVTTAQIALNVAMKANPVGIAVGAVTAAIGLSVLAWSQWGDAAEAASAKAQKAAEAESKAIDRNVGLLRDQLSIASQIERAKPGDATAERAKALSAIDTSGLAASMSQAQAREAAAAREATRISTLSPTGVSHLTGSLRDIPGQQRQLIEEQRRKELEAVKEQLEIAEAFRGKSKVETEVKITAERQREVQERAKLEENIPADAVGRDLRIQEAQQKSDIVIDAWLQASNKQLDAIEKLRMRQNRLESELDSGALSR
ncbi:MAG: hypothetical protein WD851_09375 [Pirellulales bacterium]